MIQCDESNFFFVANVANLVANQLLHLDVHRDSLRVLARTIPFIACHRNPGTGGRHDILLYTGLTLAAVSKKKHQFAS